MKLFFLALQFLTRLPTKNYAEVSELEIGKSVLFYPLVGLLIGTILVAIEQGGSFLSSSILAIIILVISVLISGALHLDGLADTADGWLSGGDKEKTLSVMKDPHLGTAGVVSVVLVLLAKYVILIEVVEQESWLVLLLAPVFARSLPLFFFLKLSYVSVGGIAQDMILHLPKKTAWVLLLLILITSLGFFPFETILTLVILFLFYRLVKKCQGGYTGDTLGAVIELSELFFLLFFVVITSLS